jgi:hypothetical protein
MVLRVLMRQVVPATCYISYARIVAILMAYIKKSHFALACVTNQGTPVYGTLELFNTKRQHYYIQHLSAFSVAAEYETNGSNRGSGLG